MKNTLLFDLDGTITDSKNGIVNSAVYALEKFGIRIEDKNELLSFIGPPLYDSFALQYGFSHNDTMLAIKYYREYYAQKGIFENEVYKGIPELLEILKSKGKKVLMATSKPEKYAKQILEHFNIISYFDFVCGATFDGKLGAKADIIRHAIRLSGAENNDCVMIGDRLYDIEGAKKNSLLSVGVLFGYGTYTELQNAGADFIAENTAELEKILLEKI